MRITAQDLKAFGVIDDIVAEPLGGAHRDRAAAIESLGDALASALADLAALAPADLRKDRQAKFLKMGRL
jgi:acetyl-CoA carboxylase carboxyl transferase subunit alpha